jgi:hypothetical protein
MRHPGDAAGWALVGAAWLLGAFGGGWILARLWKRLHPDLAFYKLWATATAVLSGLAALAFAFGAARL